MPRRAANSRVAVVTRRIGAARDKADGRYLISSQNQRRGIYERAAHPFQAAFDDMRVDGSLPLETARRPRPLVSAPRLASLVYIGEILAQRRYDYLAAARR